MGTKEMECSELKDGSLPSSVKPGFHSNWKCAWTSSTECSHEPTYLRRWLFVDYGKTLEQNHLDIMQVHSVMPMAIILLKGSIQATSGELDKQTNIDVLEKLAHSFWMSTWGSSMTPKKVSFRVPPNCICYSAPRRHYMHLCQKHLLTSSVFRQWTKPHGDTYSISQPHSLKANAVIASSDARERWGGVEHACEAAQAASGFITPTS